MNNSSQFPPFTPKKHQRVYNQEMIGLALGGGGPRGLAHIGVIKALEEANISIDCIAGTSVGALVGGLYADTLSSDELIKYSQTITLSDIASVYNDLGSTSGIAKGDKMEGYFKNIFKSKRIEDLKIPFAAVATNAESGGVVTLTSGNLARAVRASSSIPGIFGLVEIVGEKLTDGGTSEAVPVHAAKKLGADFVVAVNLDSYNFISKEKPLASDMGVLAIKLIRYHLAKEICRNADVVISPEVADVKSLNLTKFVHGEEIIDLGYKAAKLAIPEIKSKLKI